jgi:hypothetical protein
LAVANVLIVLAENAIGLIGLGTVEVAGLRC